MYVSLHVDEPAPADAVIQFVHNCLCVKFVNYVIR